MDHNRTVKTFLQNMTLEENTSMRPTGIVRRIDDLGRIVVPKEIRRVLRIREGDPLEIFTGKDGEVIIKKYSPLGELGTFAQQYVDSISQILGCPVCVADRDGLSSFWVLFSTLFFGGLFGFVGMIIAVPAFAVIYDLISRAVHRSLRLRKLPMETDEYRKLDHIDEKTGMFMELNKK